MNKYVKKLRKQQIKELQNPAEKDYMISYLGADGTAALIYDVILAPMGW